MAISEVDAIAPASTKARAARQSIQASPPRERTQARVKSARRSQTSCSMSSPAAARTCGS